MWQCPPGRFEPHARVVKDTLALSLVASVWSRTKRSAQSDALSIEVHALYCSRESLSLKAPPISQYSKDLWKGFTPIFRITSAFSTMRNRVLKEAPVRSFDF